jgi:2-methylaconitate cis-trans-isomerase PrpF
MTPAICIVAPPMESSTLSGETLAANAVDVTARSFSMGRPHRAIQLTIGMCLAVAARIEGTVVHQATRPPASPADDLRVGQPSGVLPVAATVVRREGAWRAEDVVVYRTARRLMEGNVLVPASVFSGIEEGAAAR